MLSLLPLVLYVPHGPLLRHSMADPPIGLGNSRPICPGGTLSKRGHRSTVEQWIKQKPADHSRLGVADRWISIIIIQSQAERDE